LLASLLAFLLHAPSSTYNYPAEDFKIMGWNPDVEYKGSFSLEEVFLHDTRGMSLSDPRSSQQYRPLSVLSYRFDNYIAGGSKPAVSHVHNVVLHVFVVAVFHQALVHVLKLAEPVSTAAAVVFAVHPAHVHCVSPITGRPELMLGLSQLSSLLSWGLARNARAGEPGRSILSADVALPVLCFALSAAFGAMAHELAVTAVPLVFLADIILSRAEEDPSPSSHEKSGHGSPKKLGGWQLKMPLRGVDWGLQAVCWALWVVPVVLRHRAIGPPTPGSIPELVRNPFHHIRTTSRRLVSQVYMALLHIGLVVMPFDLCLDYSFAGIPSLPNHPSLRNGLAVAAFLTLCWYVVEVCQSRDRVSRFACAWLLLLLAPRCGLLHVPLAALEPAGLLLPSAAFSILLAQAAMKAAGSVTGRSVVVLMALLGGALTLWQQPAFENHSTFWKQALKQRPQNALANVEVANILATENQLKGDLAVQKQVMELFEQALLIYPRFDRVFVERGKVYQLLGEDVLAEDDFHHAADLGNKEAHFQVALAYMTKLGKDGCDKAEWHLRRASEMDPTDHRSLTNIGICHYWLGNVDESERWLAKAIAIAPRGEVGVPADAMANIHRLRKAHEAAVGLHRLAIGSTPDNLAFRANFAYTLYEKGDYLQAAAEYDAVAAEHPEQEAAYRANADLSRKMMLQTISLRNEPAAGLH